MKTNQDSEILKKILVDNNIILDQESINKLIDFKKMVIETNDKFNLTSILDSDEFNIKHILDSLILIDFFDTKNFEGKTIVDIGTGGGFPGIPLAIVFPNTKFVLVDSTSKKIDFLKEVIKELNILNVELLNLRAEEMIKDIKYDYAISRGFSSLSNNLEILSPIVKVGGSIILYKTKRDIDHFTKPNIARDQLGIIKSEFISFSLNEQYERTFMIFSKEKESRKWYPRQFSIIKGSPLF